MQYSDLGKFIKTKRQHKGLSLNKFAMEAEIDPAILCRIENLKQGIKLDVLEKIALTFDTVGNCDAIVGYWYILMVCY